MKYDNLRYKTHKMRAVFFWGGGFQSNFILAEVLSGGFMISAIAFASFASVTIVKTPLSLER